MTLGNLVNNFFTLKWLYSKCCFFYSATQNISRASSAQQVFYGNTKSSPPQTSTLTSSSVAKFFGNLIPHKVEVRLGSSGIAGACCSASLCSTSNCCNAESCSSSGAASKPIDIVQNKETFYANQNNGASYSSGNGGGQVYSRTQRTAASYANNANGVANGNVSRSKQRNKQLRRENSVKHNQTFGTSVDDRSSNVGASTGRQLASHGLKVLLYLEEDSNIEQKSIEISLFKATGNTVVYSANGS